MSGKIDLHALYSSWDSRQLVTALKYHRKEYTDGAVSSMIAVVNSRGLSDADYSQTSEEMAFQNDVRKANSQATTNAYLGFFGTLLAHILFYVPQVQLAFSNTILDAASGLVFGLVPFFAFKKKSLVRAVLALFVSGLMGSLMGRLIGFTTALVFYIYGRKKFDPVLP